MLISVEHDFFFITAGPGFRFSGENFNHRSWYRTFFQGLYRTLCQTRNISVHDILYK